MCQIAEFWSSKPHSPSKGGLVRAAGEALLLLGIYQYLAIIKNGGGTYEVMTGDVKKREHVGFVIFRSFIEPMTENLETYYAWSMVGGFYLFGAGVDKDLEKARLWFKKSSDKRLAISDYFLGAMYRMDGQFEMAQYYFKKVVDNNWDRAMVELHFNKVMKYDLAYYYLMKVRTLDNECKTILEKNLATGCFHWDLSNHKCWPNTVVTSILLMTHLDKQIYNVVNVTSLDKQILALLLISKFRKTSDKHHISHLLRMVVLTMVKHSAQSYLI